jgi:hypothetical protein
MTTQFWLYNPILLVNNNSYRKLWPRYNMNLNEKLNAITRLIIILSLLSYLISNNFKMIITGLITISSIAILQYIQSEKNLKKKMNKEAFHNYNYISNSNSNSKSNSNFTLPTVNNPAMNVLLPEINDNPNRPRAAPSFNPTIENEINNKTKNNVVNNFDNKNNIHNRLFKDLGDNFEFDMSMRQWYSTPNTEVMNDQKGFAEYCYGDMISCKEGNPIACTNSTPPHWIN